ncbi:hypothetical protein [Streptomyces sp. TRM68416]|uniref:hypothetical protein n=1 Tax=Streptomyces sp. TRM68416 TaxID=2758412 RepID=UPI001661BBC8|nr:hypothetical protein [Streptomyces sp. TRM68416]MBD0839438.1 hypothetical protein [Streptomyces sp. TRM68416]
MTSRSRTAGNLLARLLLLGVLLIGLGVVHTLAHADAHDGVTGRTTAHHLDPGPAQPASAAVSEGHDTDRSGGSSHHTGLAAAGSDSLPEADCWASVPAGPWPAPPAQLAAGITTAAAAPPAHTLLHCRAHTPPHARGVLRI